MAAPDRPGPPRPTRNPTGRPQGLALDAPALRRRRQALGLSQETLAAKAGLATRTLQNAERGQRVAPDIAKALAGALDLTLDDLLLAAPPADSLTDRLVAGGFAPPPPIDPMGREAERASLGAAFAAAPLCLVGPPGSGKSALAAHLVASSAHPGPTCWLDAARVERHDPATTLLALARCLGFAERLPNPNLVPLDALARAFRKAFWALSPTLVLDDATSPDALTLLCDAPDRRVLVTTPSRSVAAALPLPIHELAPLSTTDALALLAASRAAPIPPSEAPAAHELIALLGRSPRALRVAGQQLAREAFTRLPDFVERVRAALANPLVPSPSGALEPSFLATWLGLGERLPEAALDALGALAIFERRRVPLSWALAAIGGEPAEARALLSRLYDLHLLTRLGPDAVGLDAESQRIARSLPSGPALERLIAFALPRLDDAPPDELPLHELLIDALSASLPDGPGPSLPPEHHPRAGLLLALAHPLAPALLDDPSPSAGRRLHAAARAAQALSAGFATPALCDLAGAYGVWLTSVAGQHADALGWLELAIDLSLALNDPRAAARYAAQRAPAGYYLGDPAQGLGDISRAIAFARAAGDDDGADASTIMRALGRAHMLDAWDEALTELRELGDRGTALSALATIDRAVCELTLGRAPPPPAAALTAAFEVLLDAAADAPLDHAGLSALAVALGVHPRPELDPADFATDLLEALDPTHRRGTFLRMDILADAFLGQRAPSAPAFAARRGTVVLPLLPGGPLAPGHHLALLLPLEPFRFLLAPPVLGAAQALVAAHLGDDHPLCDKLRALSL